MIPAENKRLSLHPRPVLESAGRRLPAPHCFFKEAERKKSQPGRCAQAALDAEEGGREEREEREGGRGEKKKSQRLFFFTCDKSCSHMGGTGPSDLTKG